MTSRYGGLYLNLRYFANIRDLTGENTTRWDRPAADVRALLHDLGAHYGPAFTRKVFEGDQLSSTVIVLVNGRDVRHLGGIEAPLKPEDTVSIFPVVAGGVF